VAGPPAHIAARRAEDRTRRRRQLLVLLAAACVLVAALALVVVELSAGGRTGRDHAATGAPSQGPSRRPATKGGTAVQAPTAAQARRSGERAAFAAEEARGNATIERLAALGLPIYCAGARGRSLAFTFDDGPGPYTRTMVHKLAKHHERATFFVVGTSIENYRGYLPLELKLAAIGDHTFTHSDLNALAPAEVNSELARTAAMIHAQSGEHVDLFRPPYGVHSATVDAIARSLGLLTVLWDIDSQDSLGANWKVIIHHVEAGMRPGAIILLHENHGQTIRAMTTLLPALRRRHLRSVSLPELLATDPPSVAQVRKGWIGCGLTHAPSGTGA
jgi:peptidoglycan/xylan/chitin deacetylase (PgdA/CDA1 family)